MIALYRVLWRGYLRFFKTELGVLLDSVLLEMVQHKLTLIRRKDTATSKFRQLLREISIVSVSCYDNIDGVHDYEVAIELLASGNIPYRDIVTHKVSLDDIQDGFATAYDKNSGSIKVHITQ